ncbi:MAG: rod shape-determining protein MreC [Acidobacteriota bacterium]
MALVAVRQRPGVVFTAAVLLQVILISAQVNTAAGVPVLQVVTFGTFAEIQRLAMAAVAGGRDLWNGYLDLRDVQAENDALRREVQALQIRLQEERALAQRSETLRQLLELRERAGLETAAAEVIGGGAGLDFRSVTIDKGTSDRVQADMAVISPAGVVGRVVLPSPRAAQVQLVIDRNAAVAALIERTRAQGIVVGQGDGTLRLEYLSSSAEVQPGDLVVTSGIDGIFPKGFVIGAVDHIDRGTGPYSDVAVRPAVDFSRLEEVLVVLTPPAARTPEGS